MKSKTIPILMSMVLGCSLGATGCGGDDNSTPTTSLNGNRMLSELSPSEVETFCLDIAQSLRISTDEIKKIYCRMTGLMAGAMAGSEEGPNEQVCEQTYLTCLEQDLPANLGQNAGIPSAEEGCRLDQVDLSQCQVTVDEAVTCLQDTLNLMRELISQLSCSLSDMPDFENVEHEVGSCTKLADRCASFEQDE